VDIWEDEDGLTLRADMPGATPEKVSVELEENNLVIEGEVDLAEYQDMSPVYTEYNVGHFQRRFNIPQAGRYDAERVQARHTDGVLEVIVPHAEAAKPRRITVSTG
jgi:HSP20 family molecular chaperone IbpA